MSKARNLADVGSNDVLDTSSTGVDVTGTVTADRFDVEGSGVLLKAGAVSSVDRDVLTLGWVGGVGDYIQLNVPSADDESGTVRFGSNGNVYFYEDTGTTPKFFWDASAERLGIGTSSPAFALDVDGVSNQFAANFTGTTAGYIRVTNDTGYADLGSTGHNMLLRTNGVERARIDSSGKVGIGTSSPNSPLEVTVKSGTSGANSGIRLISSDGGGYAVYPTSAVANPVWNTNVNSSEQFSWSVGGSEKMRIDSSGNVGIGTTSPSSFGSGQTTLEIKGNSSSYPNRGGIVTSVTQDGGCKAYFGVRADDIGSVGTYTNHDFYLYTNNNKRAQLTNNGDLMLNRGVIFGYNSTSHLADDTGVGYLAASRDNSNVRGVNIFVDQSTVEWQPVGGMVFACFGKTGLQDQKSILFRWNAQVFNGSLNGLAITTVSGSGATLSISDLGDSNGRMEIRIQVTATAANYNRIALSAWGASYPYVAATQRS